MRSIVELKGGKTKQNMVFHIFLSYLFRYDHNHHQNLHSRDFDLFSLKSKQLDNFTRSNNLKNLKTHFRTCEVRMGISFL